MMVADLTRFLCQSPEVFGLIPGRLGRHAVFFGGPTVLLGVLTVVLGLIAKPLGLLPVLFWRNAIVRRDGKLAGSRSEDRPRVSAWRASDRPEDVRVRPVR
jgi:hypothetical protein